MRQTATRVIAAHHGVDTAMPGLLTVVTPAFREAGNLGPLYTRLVATLDAHVGAWEWIIVDDHSPDDTFNVITQLAGADARVRGVRLARNSGSHHAIALGLAHARGAAAVVLAGDLQDPPELIPSLLGPWCAGAQVVWATRQQFERPGAVDRVAAGLFHSLVRRLDGLGSLPAAGADCFLLDRVAIDALAQFRERNVNLIALIAWMGFRQASVPYDKETRAQGRSGWTLSRKVLLAIDSLTAFSYFPIRWMTYAGIGTALSGFAYAGFVAWHAWAGSPPPGWSSLMVVILVVGGMQMLMLGVLGEYVWRALDEARRRPRALIEAVTGAVAPVVAGPTATGSAPVVTSSVAAACVPAPTPAVRRRPLLRALHPLVYRASQRLLAPGAGDAILAHARSAIGDCRDICDSLDIGCGPVSLLRKLGLEPVGVDSSAAQLAPFATAAPAACASAVHLPFADRSFDLVWSCGLLHHLDDEAAGRALREMLRVTRRGGRVVLFDGVRPDSALRHPLAALIRHWDRGAWMRRAKDVAALLDPAVFTCERVTYAATGLEGVLVVAQPLPR